MLLSLNNFEDIKVLSVVFYGTYDQFLLGTEYKFLLLVQLPQMTRPVAIRKKR